MTSVARAIPVLLIFWMNFYPAWLYAQKEKKIYYSLVPSPSPVTPEDHIIVTATTASFCIDRQNGAFSTVSFSPYFPLPIHTGLGIRSNLVFGNWRLIGDVRSLYYPQYTWGLHGTPESVDQLLINYKYFRFYQTLLRKLAPRLYAGIGYHLDAHVDMDIGSDSSRLRDFTHYQYGTGIGEHSISSGQTLNILYDDRQESGNYGNIVYRINPEFLGNRASWHSLYLDLRKYVPLSTRDGSMLGFWTYGWTVLHSPAPYLDLPSNGWDPYQQRSARGFPQNRFRGNSLLYGESEYRSHFYASEHLGFVAFVNMTSISEPESHTFSYFHPAFGGGIRLKFSRLSTAKIAIDCAFSDGYAGLYFNLGDTF